LTLRAALTRPVAAIGRLPVRAQLVVAMLVLLAAALFGTWWAATADMQRYLLGQLDNRLTHAAAGLDRAPRNPAGAFPGTSRFAPPVGSYAVRLTVDGRTYASDPVEDGSAGGGPAFPADPPAGGPPFTVPSRDEDGPQWRMVSRSDPRSGASVLVAANEGEVDAAVGDLSREFLLIAVGALVLMGTIGYALVRSSLRPLEEVEQATEAIAGGDLSRRAPVRRPGSEVGRLAQSFNAMIERIESAFHARQASEASARGSEERMRRFVADASHELRTPLTSIRGYAELYRQGAVTEPDDVAGVLRRIEDQAARMGLLVEDLLLLARLDQQRPLEREPVDLGVLAVDAVHDAHALAPERTVALRLPQADDEPAEIPVLGDAARLRQVLGNLVHNALTHTPAGAAVEVRARVDAGSAVLEVADAGPGLPPEQADRVFERFYRADPARGRVSGGSGLGLAIVAAIVAAHGGAVEVDTAEGVGTTFRVRLPLAG
jgi:two-component system, OmpR family, sensor kinase